METKRCPKCEREVPISEWYKNTARRDGLSAYCRRCHGAATTASLQKKRRVLLEEMGGRCVRCGYDADFRALQIDHSNGGGTAAGDNRHTNAFYNKVRASLSEYQLLCANCNQIKRIEDGEHVGNRVYEREVPTERVVRASRRWTPEQRAAQSERSKRQMADPKFKAKFLSAPNPRRAGKKPPM